MKRFLSTATLLGLLAAVLVIPLAGSAGAKALKMDAGGYSSCAIVSKGKVKCWGEGGSGALGNGHTDSKNTPVFVDGLKGVKQISTSESPCALLKSGTVWCWGSGDYGQLGNGHTSQKESPVKVQGINDAVNISSGYLHSCAVRENGTVWCWGDNSDGQVGNGVYSAYEDVPVKVKNINNAVQVDAGNEYHTCAKLSTDKVKCWGYNNEGQLGDGSQDRSNVPVSPVGLGKVKRVVVGYYETCAITMSKTVKCWGDNSSGELGIGSTGGRELTPVDVINLSNVLGLSHENDTGCAVLGTGKVKCWGENGGKFGDGTTGNTDSPVSVSGVKNVVSVSAGWYHTCILLESGTVKCTGAGGSGELGQGQFSGSDSYVKTLI